MNEPTTNKEQIFDYEKKAAEYLDIMGLSSQLNESQKKQFIELASACQLNPFKREIYPIVYKNRSGGNEISLVTGYEVYIQRANQSGLLDGWTLANGNYNSEKEIAMILMGIFSHCNEQIKMVCLAIIWLTNIREIRSLL